jgi:hypothetical protein
MRSNDGNNGGYILKLSIRSPFNNNHNALWKPQIGQSIPNSVLYAHGNKICP